MLRKKPKKKERIKVKMRVQLKNNISSDGEVVGKGAVKAQWKVKWNEGPHKGLITDQSSKSLRAWQLDLAAVQDEEVSSSDDDAEEDTTTPATDYASLTKKFETHAKSLVAKNVQVNLVKINYLSSSIIPPPPAIAQG